METGLSKKASFARPPCGTANTQLHPLLRARKSPRAFTEQSIEPEKLRSILEAARWAPSAGNIQPWRFIVAANERPEDHERMVNLLIEGNRIWAAKAPVLILSVAYGDRPV